MRGAERVGRSSREGTSLEGGKGGKGKWRSSRFEIIENEGEKIRHRGKIDPQGSGRNLLKEVGGGGALRHLQKTADIGGEHPKFGNRGGGFRHGRPSCFVPCGSRLSLEATRRRKTPGKGKKDQAKSPHYMREQTEL